MIGAWVHMLPASHEWYLVWARTIILSILWDHEVFCDVLIRTEEQGHLRGCKLSKTAQTALECRLCKMPQWLLLCCTELCKVEESEGCLFCALKKQQQSARDSVLPVFSFNEKRYQLYPEAVWVDFTQCDGAVGISPPCLWLCRRWGILHSLKIPHPALSSNQDRTDWCEQIIIEHSWYFCCWWRHECIQTLRTWAKHGPSCDPSLVCIMPKTNHHGELLISWDESPPNLNMLSVFLVGQWT